MRQQPRVPWQVKYLALVLIWGSSFLLMKVGLESLSAVQISGLRILSGAAVVSVLLFSRGGRLPTGGRVWGHLVVCGFFLGALPFTLFALSETRISSALAGIGNATTPIVAVLATIAILPGERVTGSRLVAVLVGFVGVVTIMQPWTSVDRPDLVGFSMALVGGASYGIGWTYNRRFLSGVDLGGLSQPAATLLTALLLMVPVVVGWAALQPEGLAAVWSYDAPDPGTWFWLPLACVLVLGLVGTGFAYTLQFDVVRGAGPVIGSTITYLIPVVSVLLGVFVLGETLGPWQLVGFAIVLSAAFVVNRRPRAAAAVPARRGRADGQRGSLRPSASGPLGRSDGPSSAGPAASAAVHARRPRRATARVTRPRAIIASMPTRTSRGGPEPVALPDAETMPGAVITVCATATPPSDEEDGPALAPSCAQGPRGGPRPPQQAERHEHERRAQEHDPAVRAVAPVRHEGDPHEEDQGHDEDGRPDREEHQPRGAPRAGRGGSGEPSGAAAADGIRDEGEALTPRPGRGPRGGGSCPSAPWGARGRPRPSAGTCRRRSAPCRSR